MPEFSSMLLAVLIGGFRIIGGLGGTFYVSYINGIFIFSVILILQVSFSILPAHYIFLVKAVVYFGYFVADNPMGSIENVTDLLNCYDVDRNALQTNTSIVGFGSEGEWILGLGNFFWFFGFVIIDQSNWQVGHNKVFDR